MSGSPQSLPPTSAAAEARARTFLAQEKWRLARDELKPLVKLDRARFLPLLVQANLGLARKMLANGQADEARQVVNYLATLVPADQLRTIELELAVKTGATEPSVPKFVAALTEVTEALPEAERVRLADFVVLAFEPVATGSPPQPARERLAAEVRAVHEALRAVAEARWPEAAELLRLVPHRSVVSHWAVFIKGLAAFHTGANEKAIKLLGSLPAGSVPARAAPAYVWLASETPVQGGALPPPPVLEGVCRLAGAPGVSEKLLRADRLWREGKHAGSYRVLRDGVPAFPSPGCDAMGALSEFYFKGLSGLGEDAWLDYLAYFNDRKWAGQWKNATEAMLAHRAFALVSGGLASPQELREDWEMFLGQYEMVHGKNPRLASLAYGWLGEQLALVRRAPGFFAESMRLRDPAGAEQALRRSIALDPGNRAAYLKLCDVYTAQKKKGDRNRLLDEMTARFPDDKPVLIQAARGCIDRNAFGKGLDYLARARHLDQLDPQIPEFTLVALRQQARQQFQQRRPDRARQTLAQGEAWLNDRADDFQRSRWTARVRYGVMEGQWGEAAQSRELLAEAARCAPSRPAHLLFAHLAHRTYTEASWCASPYLAEFKLALRQAPRLGDLGLLLQIVAYWRLAPEQLQMSEEEGLLARAIELALKQPFTRAEAVGLIERARVNSDFAKPIRKLVNKVLRADPLDPQFRLWKNGFGVTGAWISPGSRAEIQAILDEAVRRHDEPAMRQARQLLRDFDRPPPRSNPFNLPPDFADEEDDDDEDYEEDDDEFEEDDDDPDAFLPPEMAGEMAELMEMIRKTPASELRALRKKLGGQMPEVLFDLLVESARQGIMPPLPPPLRPPCPPKPRPPKLGVPLPPGPQPKPAVAPQPAPPPKPPRPPPPAPDPNQMDLF